MTKYILHGGATRKPVQSNKDFFREVLNGLPKKIRVLLIYFARPETDLSELLRDDTNNFRSTSPDKQIELEIASEEPETFREQIKNSDALYIRGGDTQQLLAKINRTPDFAELIKDKVYAGSSAGMYLLSRHYYSNDRKQFEQGLGILPIKSLAHWSDDKQDILEKLKNIGEDLPIVKLKEGEFSIYES